MTAQRVAVAVASLLAIAWLAVSYGNSHRIRHAQVVAADPAAKPGEVAAALRDLRADRPLDPTNEAESLSYQASIELRAGHPQAALRLLERLVHLEPDTAEAWYLIAKFAATSDPALLAEARAQFHRLDPRAPPPAP